MTDSRENFRKTAALYCKDLVDQLRDKPDFAAEARSLELMVMEALDSADVSLVREMAKVMGRVHEKAMTLYARYPQSVFLEGAIARSESIRRMLLDSAE